MAVRGSAGGPIRRDRAHFFGAFERVQQDTFQAVDTAGLFPSLDGVFPVEYRESLATVKATVNFREGDYTWLRYGLNTTSQPAGVSPTRPPQSWGDSDNRFHSINARYNIDQSANPNVVRCKRRDGPAASPASSAWKTLAKCRRAIATISSLGLGSLLTSVAMERMLRGGWGIYTDVTNDRTFSASNPNGLRNPDGSFFRVGDPVSNLAALNEGGTTGLIGEVISPRLRQPYTRQASFGWSHLLNPQTSFSVDVIHADGRDLNVRARLNSRPDGGPRRFSDLGVDPNTANFRTVISPMRSVYDALLLSLRRRSASGLDFALNYTEGQVLSAIVPLGWQMQLAPIFYYRSALPVFIIENLDRNNDFNNNDIPDRAFAFDGIGQGVREIGGCETVNCGRGAGSSQFSMRLSRQFALRGSRLTLIGEVVNLFNASNPSGFNTRRLLGNVQASAPNPDFLQPTTFSGDFQQPVQRVGQLALRWAL